MKKNSSRNNRGFTLVEIMIGVALLGVILVAIMGIVTTMQKSSTRSSGYTSAQQNTRAALDFVTEKLRQAGVGTDRINGQQWLVHAAPYQVAINADLDNGQAIAGQSPLSALSVDYSPNTVPAGGTTIYAPGTNYNSDAETVVMTLDSDGNGVVSGGDLGDDLEEGGLNPHLYVLKRYVYGYDGSGANTVRTSDLALVRGPVAYPDGKEPEPLFQYYYDHDDDAATPDKLWGDDSPEDGELSSSEISSLTPVPNNMLYRVKKIKVTVIGESNKYDKQYSDNDGFLAVEMNSEVMLRNANHSSSIIFGKVYNDANGDQQISQGESGIPDVEIRLVGQLNTAKTDNYGDFRMSVAPGAYSVKELDPYGFSSTTPNLVSITVASGQAKKVDFGDIFSSGFGVIQGTVYEDVDQNGLRDVGETGIQDVLLSLDTGEQTKTDDRGHYTFTLPLGNYILTETDADGYGSTTANSVNVALSVDGDTVTVDFGDMLSKDMGTIEGYVFLDENKDGVRDALEPGLASVSLHLSTGDSALTNVDGYYQFTISPGLYDLWEVDPDGYTSTTVNKYMNIQIIPDTTIYLNFGDMLDTDIDFVEIVIGDTERALSVKAMDFKEDKYNDMDVILGTPYNGSLGNMLIYQNQWKTANTVLSKLFSSTPTYRRSSLSDINTIATWDLSGDGKFDVLTGHQYDAGNNIFEWFNGTGGELSTTPDRAYATGAGMVVMDFKLTDYDLDGNLDLIVGLRSPGGLFTGAVKTYLGGGGGAFKPDQHFTLAAGLLPLGEVWAVDTGDVDGDGDPDIVIGTHTHDYLGCIDIYLNGASGKGLGNPGYFEWVYRYNSTGAVNDIKVTDMMEDDQDDPDILAAVSTQSSAGEILLWINNAGIFGVPDTSGYAYGAFVTPNRPHDSYDPGAACITVDAAPINRDIYPEVVFGTRSTTYYTGDIYVLKTFGMLPRSGVQLNSSSAGEVNTLDLADFNKDSKLDVVAGTRTSATQGKLVIYFFSE